jgi:hypothetical protein
MAMFEVVPKGGQGSLCQLACESVQPPPLVADTTHDVTTHSVAVLVMASHNPAQKRIRRKIVAMTNTHCKRVRGASRLNNQMRFGSYS